MGHELQDNFVWPMCVNVTCLSVNASNGSAENATEAPSAPTLTTGALVRVVVLLVIATLSLVGNSATLVSIWHMSRAARSSLYLLLAHLSVADLLVTAWCVLAEAAWTATVQWLGGDLLCKLFKYMQMFSLYLSTFILVVIGYDQLLALRYPMERARNRKCTKRLILAVWVLSALLSLPQNLQPFSNCLFLVYFVTPTLKTQGQKAGVH
ncbi:gonadotropin-releasing hormone receptor [Ixodes scapularis]|uniref:gonadotropin-releasing hormone receptor n=1 Tax=Ixodes scapularis TaxID=6945 RepID=UPI001A9F7837|nr:gonadotropin-releasing hormone receptor [Ixodes scapularis]